ncbi:YbbR-like domain-containing protein [Sporosarcina siberiensis]|uniref:YbbR-like domain-containing protein n=1 Tax=Sporosarcina siberiensis TaxID=1365606 RepID=A0ABW4SLD6_9BACL
MDKLMDSPWFLRITALFLAIVLFFSVKAMDVNVNGKTPGDQVDSIHDIPVEVFYDNENLVVTGVPATVKMAIEGPPNIVQTTKLLKDFSIFVNLNDLPMGKHQVELQSENISEKLHVRLDPATIEVLIEEKVTQTFRVDPELNDRLLAEDFQVVNMEVSPATVEVTGAKSVIESISFVKVTSTRDGGINKSFEQKARVRVLDKDLNKLNVTISPEEVSVKVEIAEYNKDVPIDLRSRGTKKPGVEIGTLTPSETKINISGPRKVLDNINILTVDVDISGVIGPETLDVNLKKPKGVSSMSLDKIKVKVEATETVIEEDTSSSDSLGEEDTPSIGTRVFENMQIVVKGLDDKYKSTFLKPVNGLLTLTVNAELDVIEALEKSDFTVFVNMEDTTKEGEQELSVSVDGPGDLKWLLSENKVTMQVELA